MTFHRAVQLATGNLVQFMTEGATGFANPAASWYHSNRYNAQSACEYCGGIVRHERWCITCDPIVQYAYGAVLDPEKLTLLDSLILHALGVEWGRNRCQGTCQNSQG
jgi:hypothetical protein